MNITNHYHSTRLSVEPETMATWEKFYVVGDIVQITKQYDLSISTVSTAFKGLASQATIDKINDYYGISKIVVKKSVIRNKQSRDMVKK